MSGSSLPLGRIPQPGDAPVEEATAAGSGLLLPHPRSRESGAVEVGPNAGWPSGPATPSTWATEAPTLARSPCGARRRRSRRPRSRTGDPRGALRAAGGLCPPTAPAPGPPTTGPGPARPDSCAHLAGSPRRLHPRRDDRPRGPHRHRPASAAAGAAGGAPAAGQGRRAVDGCLGGEHPARRPHRADGLRRLRARRRRGAGSVPPRGVLRPAPDPLVARRLRLRKSARRAVRPRLGDDPRARGSAGLPGSRGSGGSPTTPTTWLRSQHCWSHSS